MPRSGVAGGSCSAPHFGQIAIACTAEKRSIQFLISREIDRGVAAGGRRIREHWLEATRGRFFTREFSAISLDRQNAAKRCMVIVTSEKWDARPQALAKEIKG